MFETITVDLIHQIYIIYVAFDIKKTQNKHNDRNIIGKL